MDQSILNGVGKKMRFGYIKGTISEYEVMRIYKK